MNKEEIKEILDYLKDFIEEDRLEQIYLNRRFISSLLDYITNLQEENEYFNHCDEEKGKTITNLRYKIERLEEENKQLKELCDKYEEEHSTTFQIWKYNKDTYKEENEKLTQGVTLLTNELIDMTKAKEDYKSRNENAIEILNNSILLLPTEYADEVAKVKRKIRNVLQGVDKE